MLHVHFVSDAQFHREVEEGGGWITGYFHSPAVLVSPTQPLNFDELISIFNVEWSNLHNVVQATF